MKPKNLKPPYTWETRKPVIEDGILYLPEYFFSHEEYSFPLWDGVFKHKKEAIHVEFCSGNGKWIVERALQNPSINWVAVELRFERARKIWSKIKNENIENLFVVCGDAKILTRYHIPSNSLDEIFINFPDPWPKTRHAKNRLIKDDFVKEMARVLKKGGKMTFVTDDIPYFQETLSHFEKNPSFQEINRVSDIPEYGTSYFDALWRELGRPIHFLQAVNRA